MAERDERRFAPDVARTYRSERVEVTWEPRFCIHEGACFGGLPDVFQPQSRPWVLLEGADPDQVAEVVMRCPTGALHFRRLDDGPQEEEFVGEVEVVPIRNGPLFVRGRVRVASRDGVAERVDTRMALCRCGHSANKPFCDGTHDEIGFRSRD